MKFSSLDACPAAQVTNFMSWNEMTWTDTDQLYRALVAVPLAAAITRHMNIKDMTNT
jgi:hypothetical protein